MKKINLLFIVFSILLYSCNNDDSSTQEDEIQNLNDIYSEVIAASMVNSTPCTNAAEWSFTAIGSKACGGPTGFIPYSLKINSKSFLKKVENYTNKQAAYNKKWGIMSTCDVPQQPSGVDCVDEKPTLIYSN
jgi:hypothetical protein